MLQQEVVPLCYHTFEAKDGTEAFRILSEYSAIDLLFSDVLLPGPRNGYQLAKEARKHHPVLKVLFCSGYPRQPARRPENAGQEAPMLQKPFKPDDLAQLLREVLDRPVMERYRNRWLESRDL